MDYLRGTALKSELTVQIVKTEDGGEVALCGTWKGDRLLAFAYKNITTQAEGDTGSRWMWKFVSMVALAMVLAVPWPLGLVFALGAALALYRAARLSEAVRRLNALAL